ncbi:MAG: hypothetical protein KKF30_14135 [Proteobacteria bacterium]|nr:hypothetical protein [Pseudomonadota bacterium]MBU4472428.1 hypothetical protein [Pseudomonadota bacterium]MCG2751255.1 hypothetical protein [Desulfobacteraceae bacterium]
MPRQARIDAPGAVQHVFARGIQRTGIFRSAGGWLAVRAMQKEGLLQKSDKRILGDGDFVEAVLSAALESMKTRYSLAARVITLGAILSGVSKRLSITPEEIIGVSKERA